MKNMKSDEVAYYYIPSLESYYCATKLIMIEQIKKWKDDGNTILRPVNVFTRVINNKLYSVMTVQPRDINVVQHTRCKLALALSRQVTGYTYIISDYSIVELALSSLPKE
jgi:hypothetical protein